MSVKRQRSGAVALSRNIVAADTVAELFAYQAESEAQANARIQPWQADIQKGDAVRYTFDEWPDLVVYAAVLRARKGRPYIMVRAYSLVVPDGEMGDIHRSIVAQTITHDEFESARARRWTA